MVKNHKIKLNFILLLVILTFSLLSVTVKTEAATISVSAGTDAKVVDAVCRLSEAIENINNQAQTNADCAAGTGNDVINLPTGTITLTADLPALTRSVTIQGQGTNRSVIDGAGQYKALQVNSPTGEMVFKEFKVRAHGGMGIWGTDAESISVRNVEIDGTNAVSTDMGDGATFLGGFGFIGFGSEPPKITIDGLYVHDLSAADANFLVGVAVKGPTGKIQTVTGRNITVANLTSTTPGGQLIGVFNTVGLGDGTYSPIQGTYENVTIENIKSLNGHNVSGFALTGVVGGGDSTGDITLRNATIRNVTTGSSALGTNGGVALIGAGMGSGDHFEGSLTLQNVLITHATVGGVLKGCNVEDIGSALDLQGTASLSIESLGGNISDDESCNDFFKHATDQKNKTKLKDTLGALSDNGGSIPTIPLKAGSPAIDAGVCKDASTKDARGVSRPQGSACDAGAFEVRQAAMSSPQGSPNTATNKKIFIDAPVPGAVVRSASIIPSSEANSDSSHDYPLGLVGFTIEGVPSGSKQTMNLSFEYPGSWSVDDSTKGLVKVDSSVTKLTDINGEQSDAKAIITFLSTGSEVPGFGESSATATRDSEKIAYSSPSQSQRAKTYLSFAAFGRSGLDAVFVTGDSGYQTGQLIPESDIKKGDPIISVTFYGCDDAACAGEDSGAYTIRTDEWESNETLQAIQNLLKSLRVT